MGRVSTCQKNCNTIDLRRAQVNNYRPISLLPAFSKIFEKAVFIQLYEYFNKNNPLYKSQYGFRTLHYTELASL